MKKIILLIGILILSLGAFSKTKRLTLDKKNKEVLLEIFKVNERLHSAYFKYNAEEIEKNAEVLIGALESIKNPKVKKEFKESTKRLEKIKKTNDRKKNDHLYHLISKDLIKILNKYDLGSTYNVYYCPMIQKSWVQNSKKMEKVHNPFAPWMAHCGAQQTKY